MSTKLLSFALLCCIAATLCLLCFTDEAHAKGEDVGADKNVAQSEGLKRKEFDKDRLPGTLEYALVIGSIAAVIGVVKFV